MIKPFNRFGVSVALGLVLAFGVAVPSKGWAANKADPSVIEFNYGVPTSLYPALYVAQSYGLFKKHGLEPHFFSFQSGAPLLAALRSGSLDVATTGLASVFALGQGIAIKYIMWEGNPSLSEALVARSGLSVSSVNDLAKLKRIGVPVGTCSQVSLYYAAKKAGVAYSSLNTVNIAPPLFANAFRSQAIDAGIAWAPYSMELQALGNKILGYDPDWTPDGGACPDMTIARAAALQNKPQLGYRLVAVHEDAVKIMEAHRDQTADIVAKKLGISKSVAAASLKRYLKNYPTIDKQLDPHSSYSMVSRAGLVTKLELANKAFAALGVIKKPLPLKTLERALSPEYLQSYYKSSEH